MADVPGKFYRATKVRTGVSPSSPGAIEGEVTPPLNPPGGGLNSVGLTMPSAFTVANSPLTANGTIGVTGAGNVGQYIRGDGSLADFPQASGGGSSVSYYLNGSVSQGTIGGVAYRELNKVPILGAGTDFSIAADGYIASFITDAGDPNLLEIPAGNWNLETYFSASSSGGTPTFYVELYKVSGTTATLIASSSSSPELIAFGTNLSPYFSTLAVPQTTLALTDRLALRYYVNHSGRTITMHTENNHLCQVITTFTTGITALNGLTAQVQNFAVGTSGSDFNIASATATHTFNLPTASATNRGALSSADWSLFTQAYNDKINSASVTGTTTKTLTLVQQDGGTITASWSDLNTDAVTSVFGRTGAVVAANGDYNTSQVTESGNLYYTDARSRAALSFAAGSGAYNTSTGVITIPTNNNQIANGAGYITSAALAGYLPLSGGVMTGPITTPNGTFGIVIGDDCRLADRNVANTLFVEGNQNTDRGYINFSQTSGNALGAINGGNLTWRGDTVWTSGNINPVTSVTASSPLASSGGTTPNITIQQASGSQSGFLSSIDWTTFNNKQNALTNPVTGTGTTNYLPKFTGSTTIGNSALQETNNNLGLGVTPSAWNSSVRVIEIANTGNFIGNSGQDNWLATNTIYDSGATFRYARTGSAVAFYSQSSGGHFWFNAPIGTAGNSISLNQAMTLFSTSNLSIGSPSDTGYRLFVNGNTYIRSAGNTSGSFGLVVQDSSANNMFLVRNDGAATFSSSVTADSSAFIGQVPTYGSNFAQFSHSSRAGANQYSFLSGNAGDTYVNSVNAQPIYFRHNNVNLAIITSGGNVGIGTPSPQSIFHIGKDAPANAGVKPYTGLSASYEGFLFDYYYNTSAANVRVFDIAALGFAVSGAGGSELRFLTVPQTSTNTPLERMRITSSGNLGLGVTPSAWNLLKPLEIGNAGNFFAGFQGGSAIYMGTASYYNSGWKYATTGDAANLLDIGAGAFTFSNAASGTAGNSLTWTPRMTLNASGNLLVGTTTDNGARLQVEHNGNSPLLISTSSTTLFTTYRSNSTVVGYIGNGDGIVTSGGATNFGIRAENDLIFTSGGNNRRMTITSGGNVLIASNSDNGQAIVQIGGSNNTKLSLKDGSSQNGMRWESVAGANAFYLFNGTFGTAGWGLYNITTAGLPFWIQNSGAATFSSSVTATSFFESSDATLKKLVEDNYQAKGIDSVVAKLYIKNGKEELGYFAQDLQGVLPSAVSKGSDGLLNLSYREVHTAKIAYLEEEIRQIKKRYEIN